MLINNGILDILQREASQGDGFLKFVDAWVKHRLTGWIHTVS